MILLQVQQVARQFGAAVLFKKLTWIFKKTHVLLSLVEMELENPLY